MVAKSAHQIRFCLSDLECKDVAEQAAASLIKLVLDDPNSTRVHISLLLTGESRIISHHGNEWRHPERCFPQCI